MPKALYGHSYFLTIQERDQVLTATSWMMPNLLSIVTCSCFSVWSACRHGDLVTFTPKNIIDGVLEYIPIKTKGKSGDCCKGSSYSQGYGYCQWP